MSRARYVRQQKRDKYDRIVDLTATATEQQADANKTLKATVGNRNNQPVFTTVKEDRGGGVVSDYNSDSYQDEYSKYD